jgi:hypothetical protein
MTEGVGRAGKGGGLSIAERDGEGSDGLATGAKVLLLGFQGSPFFPRLTVSSSVPQAATSIRPSKGQRKSPQSTIRSRQSNNSRDDERRSQAAQRRTHRNNRDQGASAQKSEKGVGWPIRTGATPNCDGERREHRRITLLAPCHGCLPFFQVAAAGFQWSRSRRGLPRRLGGAWRGEGATVTLRALLGPGSSVPASLQSFSSSIRHSPQASISNSITRRDKERDSATCIRTR